MSTTYRAILTGDRVQWLGDAPHTNGGVEVEITVTGNPTSDEADVEERRRQLAAALDALTASGVHEKFGDPVEWQREQRKDRPLPGRED